MASAEGVAPRAANRGRPRLQLRRGASAVFRWCRTTNLGTAFTIGGIALVLRVVWVLSVHRHGFALNDAFFYDVFAQQLAKGHGYTFLNGAPSAAWPPGWPLVLSLAFRVFGTDEVVGQLLNSVIGAATVMLLYLAALRAYGRRAAIIAAVVMALFPAQIFLTDVMLSETFNTFLIVLLFAVLSVIPAKRWAAVVVGLLIGAATLTRGENIGLVIVPMVVWWPLLTPRARALRFLIMVVAAAVLIVPWTIRNIDKLHTTIFISTNSGQTLYSGHNPHATGAPTYAPQSLVARFEREPAPRSEVDRNRFLTNYALKWAVRHPGQELVLIPKRFLALIGGDGTLLPEWVNPDATAKPAIGRQGTARLELLAEIAWFWLLAAFVAALVLGAKALWRRWKNLKGSQLLATRTSVQGGLTWIGASIIVYCVGLFGQWRYHIALEPLMILVVAPAAAAAWALRGALAERLAGPSKPDGTGKEGQA